ncbi:PREDICTED: 60S ribosomal protein L29-like [Myotis davidii]|uniref:60S ribosomal protein L29-like n=1 Tax=Myotis davidii TaxID=225400 RepID=UPI0003EC154C|nr:PREDICTED: 60S ribosomal protein L29-like [Myotis davidii]
MRFTKKNSKKGLKKIQANKAMSTGAGATKALIKPKELKPRVPKGGSCELSRLAYIAHPKLGKHACSHTTKGLRLCPPKAKAETKPQAAGVAAAQAQAPTPKAAQTPTKAPEQRPLSADVSTEGLV